MVRNGLDESFRYILTIRSLSYLQNQCEEDFDQVLPNVNKMLPQLDCECGDEGGPLKHFECQHGFKCKNPVSHAFSLTILKNGLENISKESLYYKNF